MIAQKCEYLQKELSQQAIQIGGFEGKVFIKGDLALKF